MLNGRTLPIVLIFSLIFTVVIIFLFTTVPFLKNLLPFKTPDVSSPTSAQNVSLEYWGMFESPEAMNALISKYNESHPGVKITYVDRNFDGDISTYKNTLLTRLKAGNGPAIFRAHSTWMPEYINEVSLNNQSVKLEEFRERFYPVAETQCVLTDGRVICVPLMYDGLALLYNKEMFSALGIGEPDTWDEVREAALKLTQRGDKDVINVAGLTLGTSNNVDYSTDILGLMFLQSGVTLPDGIDTDAAKAALTFYTNFATTDKVWSSAFADSINVFASQQAAMTFGTTQDILKILEINPTLQLGVLPVPQLPDISGGTTSDTWASFWVESVSADASKEEQKAAWDFLEWMSQPDQQKMLFAETANHKKFGFIPGNREVQEIVADNPYLANIAKQAVYSRTSIISDKVGNDKYSDIFKKMITNIEEPKNLKDTKDAYKKLTGTPNTTAK
jgi:ABC-type glycerol-3-phosphate transport system substrate-binding protein